MGTSDPYAAPSDNCLMTPVKDGTSGHPITVSAYNNEDVLIDGRTNVMDYNGDGNVDQTWNQCHWSSSCTSPCNGIPDQTSCNATWYMNYQMGRGLSLLRGQGPVLARQPADTESYYRKLSGVFYCRTMDESACKQEDILSFIRRQQSG